MAFIVYTGDFTHFFFSIIFKKIFLSLSDRPSVKVKGSYRLGLFLFSLGAISVSSYAEVRLHCELMLGLFVLCTALQRQLAAELKGIIRF